MDKYTVFITYLLETKKEFRGGYSKSIHCNYINSVVIENDNISEQEIKLSFRDVNDLKFVSDDDSSGTGFTVNKIWGLYQYVKHDDDNEPKPLSDGWSIYDLSNQISGYNSGNYITKRELKSTTFRILLSGGTKYKLDYLTYPSLLGNNQLSFGEETIFLGNVKTDIRADVYTTDLVLSLPLNGFNSSTNETWDGISTVYVTEIGIYDGEKNLVAIGKLNNPVPKNSSISRTIEFSVDF